METIDQVIEAFRKARRLTGAARFSSEEILSFEQQLGVTLPSNYKRTLAAGHTDKGTFHFIEPYRLKEFPEYVVFAEWNRDLFLFHAPSTKEEYPIYLFIPEYRDPEKEFDTYLEWIHMVLLRSTETMNPE